MARRLSRHGPHVAPSRGAGAARQRETASSPSILQPRREDRRRRRHDRSEVRERAFAMPLTQPGLSDRALSLLRPRISDHHLSHRSGEAPRDRPGAARDRWRPLVKFEFIRMPNSTGFGDYTETGQVIPVRFNGPQGQLHALHVPQRPSADRRRARVLGLPEEARRVLRCTSRPTRWSARSTTARCASPPAPWATSTGS